MAILLNLVKNLVKSLCSDHGILACIDLPSRLPKIFGLQLGLADVISVLARCVGSY